MTHENAPEPTTTPCAPHVGARVWRVLMTPIGKRVKIVGREPPHGIALFSVLIALALMSSVVTDLGYNEMVRYKLAANDRDALKAQALAESGLHVSRLLLAVQAAVQPMLSQLAQAGIPLPAHTIWELVPLESDLLKGLATGELQSMLGLDVSSKLATREEAHQEKMAESATETPTYGNEMYDIGARFEPPVGGFGAFDGGFSVKIADEERKVVSLRGWTSSNDRFVVAQRLYTLFMPERYDFLFEERDSYGERTDRYELVANIHDWIDTNEDATDPKAEPAAWGRAGTSSEDSPYNVFDDRVRPKNEYFDSQRELLRVKGFNDAHWRAFGDSITVYGEAKVNILSAPAESVEALIRMCATNPGDFLLLDPIWMRTTVMTWLECKRMGVMGGGCMASPEGFVSYLQSGLGTNGTAIEIDRQRCLANISTESKNFTVKSTGVVGNVTRTITMVMRVHAAIEERYYYSITE
jgi:hypothetical protein